MSKQKTKKAKLHPYAVEVVMTGKMTIYVDATSASEAELLAHASDDLPDFERLYQSDATATRIK